jgi:acetylornithine deacetylase/succinyl-diaminopimelate desuccinylase-like protein
MPLHDAVQYARQNQTRFIEDLHTLLRFPTISAEYTARQVDFEACSAWLVEKMLAMGFQRAESLPTGAAPVVYGEWTGAENAPTVLIYGHYDVMPVDPLDEWHSPPFHPEIRQQRLYARGASDDKGQFFALLCAAEAWLQSSDLPVNVKVLIEGEEEELSPHLPPLIRQQRERLRCDGIFIADMGGLDPMIPLVEYGTRGNCSMEIAVSGPARDLHSGTYGGAVDNPLNVLARLLAAIQDGHTRRIQVPRFYDKVQELTPRQRTLLDEVPITDEAGLFFTGVPALGGEPGYPLKERISSRPTFEVHGVVGGYSGAGVKTVIPAQVAAKISFRLVPDQRAAEIYALVEEYLRQIAPPTVQLAIQALGLADPATTDLDAPVMQAAKQAFEHGFGAPLRFVRGGGSLPILNTLQELLHPDAVCTGLGLPNDNEHSPNESLALSQFSRGTEMMIHFFERFAQVQQG